MVSQWYIVYRVYIYIYCIYMIPSGYVNVAIENGPVEIVDLPNFKMVDLSIVFCMFTKRLYHH